MSFLGFSLPGSKPEKPPVATTNKSTALSNGRPAGTRNGGGTSSTTGTKPRADRPSDTLSPGEPSFKDLCNSPMGRKLNLAHLTEEECEKVLHVIQRDFELRNAEKERLGKIEDEIKTEDSKTTILAKQKQFNENCCMRCFSRFIFIFNQKVECSFCDYYVCKNCADWVKEIKEYVCHVCKKQRELSNQSCEWFYNNVKKKFKRFGSAKVVRSLYKRKSESDSENDSGYDPSQYSNSMPIGNRKMRATIEGFFGSIDKHINAIKGGSDDRGLSDDDRNKDNLPLYKTPYTCTVSQGKEKLGEVQEREVSRFTQHLNCVVDDIHRVLDDSTHPPGKMEDHTDSRMDYERLLDNHRLNITQSLSNLIHGLHTAADNQDVTDPSIPSSSKHHYVKQLLVEEVEKYTGAPVDLEETTSEYGTEDGSVCDIPSPRPYEELLSDAIIKKILQDRVLSHQARKDEYDEQRLRKSLTKLSNNCTVNQLSEFMSGESGTETDDVFSSSRLSARDDTRSVSSLSSAFDIIEMDGHGRSTSPFEVISSGDENDGLMTKGRKAKNLQKVKKARDRLKLQGGDPELSSALAFFGKSDSSDTLIDSDSDSDLDELVRRNESVKTKQLNAKNKNEIITRSGVGKLHSLRSGSDSSADRTLRNSNYSEGDLTITLTSPDNVTTDVLVSPGSNTQRDENLNVIVNNNDELRELKSLESPRQQAVPRDVTEEVAEGPGSDAEVQEEVITKAEAVREQSAPDLLDEEEDIESALAFAQQRREQMALPDFQFDERGGLLSTGDIDLDDISTHSRHGDEDHYDDDDVMSTTTMESEITYLSHWDLGSSGRPNSLFSVNHEGSFISPYDNFGDKKIGKDIDGPVFMFVPKSEAPQSPRIGERTLDDLSDLSENDSSGTDIEDLISSDEEPEDIMSDFLFAMDGQKAPGFALDTSRGHKSRSRSRRNKSIMADSGVQTEHDDLEMFSMPRSNSEQADVQLEYMTSEVSAVTSDGKEVEPLSQEDLEKRVQEEFLRRLAEHASDDEADGEERDPRFYRRPQTVSVPEAECARVVCETGGTQPLDVFWYKEEAKDITQIEESDRVEIAYVNGQHVLEIYSTTMEDAGQYTCIAVNEKGQAHKAFAVKVEDNSSAEKKAPEFLKGLQDNEVIEGNEVNLRCKLSGYPQPRVMWYKDGKRIKNSDNFKIEKIGNRDYSLTIAKVSLEDDAEYSVTARNVSGEAKSRAQLMVEPAPPESTVESDESVESGVVEGGVYPDTDSLLQIAERVHAARTSVTSTAENILGSADHLSSIHSHLDEMDRKLNNLEEEVQESMTTSQADSLFSEEGSSIHSETHSLRDAILKEHEDMKGASRNVRGVTSRALEVIVSAEDVIQSERSISNLQQAHAPIWSDTETRRDEYIIPKPKKEDLSDEEEELQLSFAEFEKLYKEGYISKEQIRTGRVNKKDLHLIKSVLATGPVSDSKTDTSEASMDDDEDDVLLNCGLKRVDSKRYKRDYVINRSPQVSRRQWEVMTSIRPAAEVVKATPAGQTIPLDEAEDEEHFVKIRFPSEVPSTVPEVNETEQEVKETKSQNNSAEDEIYLTASKVYSLEARIKQLEGNVEDQELEDEQEADQNLTLLEEEVARAAAKVAQSEQQVDKIEESVQQLQEQIPRSDEESDIKSVSSASLFLSSQSATDDVFSSDSLTEVAYSPSRKLRGSSTEEDIPESRAEFSNEEVEMPSVRSLMSKFNSTLSSEDAESSLKRGSDKDFQVHSLTGRDLPKPVREKLRQSAPVVQNNNIRIQDLSYQKKRPGFLSMLDDSYLDQKEPPLDPTMQKGKYRDTFDRVLSPGPMSPPHGPRSSTPRKAEQIDMSFNVSGVTNRSMYSTRTDESVASENTTRDSEEPIKSASIQSLRSVAKTTAETNQDVAQAGNRSSGAKSKSTGEDSTDDPPKRNKTSSIMARAAFWDQRVDQGIASDKDSLSVSQNVASGSDRSDEEF